MTLRTTLDLIRLRSCVDDRGESSFCDWVYDVTGNRWLAESTDWLLAKPASIIAIIVLAVLMRTVLHRIIRRLAHRAAEGTVPGVLAKGAGHKFLEASPLLSERRKQRAETMASVLRSVTTGVIMSVALLMVLDVIGLPIGPLLASAGIVGVAVGFGAQTLVKDFLSGIFLILEDQFGVGDLVDTGLGTVGTVEVTDPSLRLSDMRDSHRVLVDNHDRIGNTAQIRQLAEAGYAGCLSFEPFARSVGESADIGSHLRRSIDYIIGQLEARSA